MFFFCSQCAVADLPCLSPFHDVYVNNVSSVARKGQPDNIHVLYVSLFHCRSNYTQICGSEGGGGGLQIKVVKYRWMFTAVLRRPIQCCWEAYLFLPDTDSIRISTWTQQFDAS